MNAKELYDRETGRREFTARHYEQLARRRAALTIQRYYRGFNSRGPSSDYIINDRMQDRPHMWREDHYRHNMRTRGPTGRAGTSGARREGRRIRRRRNPFTEGSPFLRSATYFNSEL